MNEHRTTHQHALASFGGDSQESESMQRAMVPPPFQLMANPVDPPGGPGGNPKKKVAPPTNDHPVTREDRNRVRPRPVPAEIVREIGREVKGIEQLQLCGEMIIVHSPCYSAEIEMVMDMVNKGEMEYEVGKQQILDRLTYLLQNEFKNAEGEVNDWAETNKGEETVKNEGNMGADYYKLGQGGPQYLALTSWNDATDPSKGANNYTVYRHERPGKDEGGNAKPEKPFQEQEYGMPLTSRNGEGKGDSRAKHVGTGFSIDDLLILFGLLGAGAGTGTKSIGERSQTIGSGTPALHDMRDDPRTETEEEKAMREKKELEDAERQKGANTILELKIMDPGESSPGIISNVSLGYVLNRTIPMHSPETIYQIKSIDAKDKGKPFFTSQEVLVQIESRKNSIRKKSKY